MRTEPVVMDFHRVGNPEFTAGFSGSGNATDPGTSCPADFGGAQRSSASRKGIISFIAGTLTTIEPDTTSLPAHTSCPSRDVAGGPPFRVHTSDLFIRPMIPFGGQVPIKAQTGHLLTPDSSTTNLDCVSNGTYIAEQVVQSDASRF